MSFFAFRCAKNSVCLLTLKRFSEILAKRMDVKPSTWPVLLGLRRQPDNINNVKGDAFAGDLKDFDAVKEFIDGIQYDKMLSWSFFSV